MIRKKIESYLLNKLGPKYHWHHSTSDVFDSSDSYLERDEFKYILWLDRTYSLIKETPGHIVEIGVARGRNSIIFGHLINMNGDSSTRRYYGFDTFSGYTEEDLKSNKHLSKVSFLNTSLEFVSERLKKTNLSSVCSLIKGDIRDTLPTFLNKTRTERFQKGNCQAAMLYIDCNAYEPAFHAMELLKPFMSPGGIICIDEKMQGGETKALTEFCRKYNLKYRKDDSPFSIPAYTRIR